jgi:hypothetical protein
LAATLCLVTVDGSFARRAGSPATIIRAPIAVLLALFDEMLQVGRNWKSLAHLIILTLPVAAVTADR